MNCFDNSSYGLWIKIAAQIAENPTAKIIFECPQCNNQGIDFAYVGDAEKAVGYLCVWCKSCNKGIRISRVEIPKGANRILLDDTDRIQAKIPNFEQVEPIKSDFWQSKRKNQHRAKR